jgi:hypothetical protein
MKPAKLLSHMIHDINKTNQFEDSSTPPQALKDNTLFCLIDKLLKWFNLQHYTTPKTPLMNTMSATLKKHGKIKYPTRRNYVAVLKLN